MGRLQGVALSRLIATFCGVNLVVAVPLAILYLICVPQLIAIDVNTGGKVVSIAVSYGKMESGEVNFCSSAELYDVQSTGSGLHLFRGQFPRAFVFDAPAFFIRSDSAVDLTIGEIRKVVGPFCKKLSPVELIASYQADGTNSLRLASNGMLEISSRDRCCHLMPIDMPVWSSWSLFRNRTGFDQCGLMAFVALELMLLLLLIGVAYVRKRTTAESCHIWQSIFLALIAVFFFFYIVPLQSYYSNLTVFPFRASRLLIDASLCSAAVFLVVCCGLCLTELLLGRVVHFALFAFLVYEYLEVGVLLNDAPSFTGDMSYYCDWNHVLRDCLILAYILTFLLVLYSKLKKYFPWMLAVLAVFLTAALFDSCLGSSFKDVSASSASKWVCARAEVPKKVKYSANRNVIILVLDAVTSEVAKDAVLESSDMLDEFNGFVAYDLNIGTHSRSELATVNIFTGDYCRTNYYNKLAAFGFMNKMYARDSALVDFLVSPFKVYCIPSPEFGYCLVSDDDNLNNDGISAEVHDISNSLLWCPHGNPMLSFSVMTLSMFRIAPFAFKKSMFEWLSPIAGYAEEDYIYPLFRAAPIKEVAGAFLYCHTRGVHIPHDVSKNGARHGVCSPSYDANLYHAKSVFAELAKTLHDYKTRGIYDNSTIFVIADHGAHLKNDAKHVDAGENALPPSAFPMLWVKPANSNGPMVFDKTTPTTHGNIHKVLRMLKHRDLGIDEIATTLKSERRVFIINTRNGYDQWEVGESGSVLSFERVAVP